MLLPSRWIVERDFAWASRFRRLVRDYERLPQTVAGLHFVAFACLMVHRAIGLFTGDPQHTLAGFLTQVVDSAFWYLAFQFLQHVPGGLKLYL